MIKERISALSTKPLPTQEQIDYNKEQRAKDDAQLPQRHEKTNGQRKVTLLAK